MSSNNVKQLYKRFLRAHQKFPAQEQRATRFSQALLTQIRTKFRLEGSLDQARLELEALERIANHPGLPHDSLIRLYLPPSEQYKLLDSEAQKIIKKDAGPLNYFKQYLNGKSRRTN